MNILIKRFLVINDKLVIQDWQEEHFDSQFYQMFQIGRSTEGVSGKIRVSQRVSIIQYEFTKRWKNKLKLFDRDPKNSEKIPKSPKNLMKSRRFLIKCRRFWWDSKYSETMQKIRVYKRFFLISTSFKSTVSLRIGLAFVVVAYKLLC
jgi:hypothetical protein